MANRDLVPIAGAGGGGGKGGGGGSRSPVEAPDSLRSTQYARVINLICEGEVEGIVGDAAGIYVDDTPLANPDGSWNFIGAGIEWRYGTATQAPINGFSATESESSVGVTVTVDAPVIRSVSNPNLNAVRVTLGFPALSNTDTTTGDVTGVSVQLALDVQKNGGGFQQVYVDTVTGKTSSRYQRSYRISLARFGAVGGTYDIRVRRLTPDSTTQYLANAFQWETMTEIVDSNLMYPYSAIVGVQVDASTFRQIPKLSFDIKMRRVQVPSNYDPVARNYSGTWDGTFRIAWSDNPAWILYDLATTERFGLGGYITPAMIDKWTLYAIAQYCDGQVSDGMGGYEPRYTCSIYLQTREDAITLLQQIAAIFNGMIFWSGGMLTVSADMPADPVMEYTAANVIDGIFVYQGTPLNQRHTVALVTWNNRANRCQQEIEYVEDRDERDQRAVALHRRDRGRGRQRRGSGRRVPARQVRSDRIGPHARTAAHRHHRSVLDRPLYRTEHHRIEVSDQPGGRRRACDLLMAGTDRRGALCRGLSVRGGLARLCRCLHVEHRYPADAGRVVDLHRMGDQCARHPQHARDDHRPAARPEPAAR
jgi:predicted phage tail protein